MKLKALSLALLALPIASFATEPRISSAQRMSALVLKLKER